ncbi:PSD1 and planctomycete cytochrome C domain-containing protein [Akkermansiaceae bacterium]|nr:PSD1 and planctomycete cytochrome C domain-containing protein [Akkermansiaceae bacterium]MDB4302453.1 PSD1 and planctomycete cytochrome C domain-containing protein [bacterium]MDB4275586.1 PSD1 and planctomycete cytochrome C domain-containing protein [Akkermansiaceae bacterium]MDB4301663.1 PSD1 and planctomycete cytochrome C domain-containing protein [Akkermansiaceae bacterium]MDB4305575.1 PSD1 and planctomycete cytochrome C domain-containing protein [Akkermansiaceae bacterium]
MKSSILLLLATASFLKADEIDFARDIRPILNANCTSCHGGVKMSGDVSFIYRDLVIAKGKSGKTTVVPGDPDASEMMVRITTDDPDDLMPQPDHGPRLSDQDVDLIRQWIKEGATWSNHWSFESPTRHKTPTVQLKDWSKGDIDRFVLAKLEEVDLSPNQPASSARLLRRVHIDLTGYPPTIVQLDAFEKAYASNADQAVSEVIDSLLKENSFGEKWATQWLDLARYADSEGLGADRAWTTWPYRDWVIRALNEDLPYDQFLKKQLAGDLFPDPKFDDLIATNFHRLTQQNQEGGTDNEEFRMMAVMDRVNTTWTGLQGITFECVQCHDHPYDPITHEEYYQFLAFFNSSRDLDLANHFPTLRVPRETKHYAKALELKKKADGLRASIFAQSEDQISKASWQKIDQMKVTSQRMTSTTKIVDGFLEFHATGTLPRGTSFTLEIPKPSGLERLTALRIHTLPIDIKKAKHSGFLGAVLSRITLSATIPGEEKPRDIPLQRIVSDDAVNFYNPDDSLKKGGSGWGATTHQYHPRSCVVVLKDALTLPDGAQLKLILKHDANAPTGPLATKRGRLELSDSPELLIWASAPETQKAYLDLSLTDSAYNRLGAIALPTMESLPPKLSRSTHLFERGNWLEKDKKPLKSGTPASLPPLKSKGEEASRLDLANWIASPQNPFTSRVLVSRIWEQLFGRGLVETMEDFGSSGLAPSHPMLLDDLAVRFQTEMDYSVKTLIREIMNSATYRQSSERSSLSAEKDPRNRLISRGPRNRLPAELVRDSQLSASGLLNPALYGSPVRPPIPAGVWKPFSDGPWNASKEGDPNRYRRSLYTYKKRSIPHPSMDAFDAPTREVCSPRRLTSNTPLGALVTLNDEAFAEMSQGLARRMKYDTEGDTRTKLIAGFRMATSLKPSEKQLEIITDLFDRIAADYTANPKDYAGLAGTPDGAAFTIVASTLLNMDDALTK